MKLSTIITIIFLLKSILVRGTSLEDDDIEETSNIYEDEIGAGGMVEGSWSIGGYGSHYAYECSGIAGATDC